MCPCWVRTIRLDTIAKTLVHATTIQDSLVERIEKAAAKDLVLGMTWKDDKLEILLQSDGKELPPDGELQSGLRRSERLDLLRGESQHETRPDGTVVLNVHVPIRSAPQLIS